MAVTKSVTGNPYRNGGDTIYHDGTNTVIAADSSPLASVDAVAAAHDPGPGGGRFFQPAPAPDQAPAPKPAEASHAVKPTEPAKPAPAPVKPAPAPAPAKPAEVHAEPAKPTEEKK